MTDHRKILATFTLNDTLQFRLTDAGLAHLSASTCLAKVENDGTCKMQAWEFASVFGPAMRLCASSMIEACRVEVLEDHYACAIRLAGPAPAPALAHINRVRASRYEQPLDPTEAGWTGEDVEREAVRLGWTATKRGGGGTDTSMGADFIRDGETLFEVLTRMGLEGRRVDPVEGFPSGLDIKGQGRVFGVAVDLGEHLDDGMRAATYAMSLFIERHGLEGAPVGRFDLPSGLLILLGQAPHQGEHDDGARG